MFSKTSILALAAATFFSAASAQSSSAYTDSDTSIAYQQYSTTSGGGYSFGIAFPSSPTDEFIGKVVGPVKGWSGVSFGGGMVNSLLLIAWANGQDVQTSLRLTSSYVAPEVYTNASTTLTKMYSTVNNTHFSYTFRCKGCVSWGGSYGFNASSETAIMGYALSSEDVSDVTTADATLQYHNSGMGQYGMQIGKARSADYESWIKAAAGAGVGTGTGTGNGNSTATTVPSATVATNKTSTTAIVSIQSSTTVLGEADYIVVGGGAGGLVAADRLSEGGATVILIERGPPSTWKHGGSLAPTWLKGKNLTRFDVPGLCNQIWVDSKGIACEDIDHMAGCVLGGGTAVNAGMFFRPQDRDWDYNFPTGWKSTEMTAATDRMFSRIPSTDTPSMDGHRYLQETYDVLGSAAKSAGWKEVTVNKQPNEKNRTYSHAPFMYSDGERGGPLATYLVSAKQRKNFQMVLNTMVRRVTRTGSTVTGVEVYASSTTGKTGIYKLKTGGKVVLSAGAFGTPKILFRSGIGPRDQLKVVAASAADGSTFVDEKDWIISPVGYNTMDHPNTDMVISHPRVDAYDFYGAYKSPVKSDAEAYLGNRSGILATAAPGIPLVLYDQITGSDGIVRQLQWTARAEGSLGESGDNMITISQYLGTGFTSRGRITIKSNLNMAVSTLPYLHDAADKEAVVQGVANMMAAIKGWNGLNGTRITMLKPSLNQTAEEYVNSYVQNRGSNHWMGSAKLGEEDGTKGDGTSGSVVDLDTKVYGTDNLFVIDASIFPGHVATNPSAPILIAAEHAVERILALGTGSRSNNTISAPVSAHSAIARPTVSAAASSAPVQSISTLPVGTASAVSNTAPIPVSSVSSALPTTASGTPVASAPSESGLTGQWYQCGGKNFKESAKCPRGSKCVKHNEYYSQCL